MTNQLSTINYQLSTKAHPQAKNGYTLIEVLIYSGILAVFLLLVTQLFISIRLTNAQAISLVGMQKNCRQIIADMTQTIRGAENVMVPLPGESTAILSLNNGLILYQLVDGVLVKVDDGQAWDLTTDEVIVSGLSFENLVESTQTATIKIEMTVQSSYLLEGGRRLSEMIQTTAGLR